MSVPTTTTGAYGYSYTTYRPPSEAELAVRKLKDLTAAVSSADSLLRNVHFAANPQALLFELERCYFFRGAPA